MHYFKGPLVLRISLLISPWAVLLSLSPKTDEAGWGLGRVGGIAQSSFLGGAVWAAVGGSLFFLLFFLFLTRK